MATVITADNKNIDTRIIQTVRNLKKKPSRQSNETISDSENSNNLTNGEEKRIILK